jgi:hypothetical protein
MLQRLRAYIRRWGHGISYFPALLTGRLDQAHRDLTSYREPHGFFKTTTIIACDCGKVFWLHEVLRDLQQGFGVSDAELVRRTMEQAGMAPPRKYR